MAKKRPSCGAGFAPDRRLFFGVGGRDTLSARSLASRISASSGARGGGGTALLNFPLLFPPTLLTVTPNTGLPAGGDVVTLGGANFQPGATVTFGGVAATGVTFLSPTAIVCTTPAHASGAVNVTVTNPDLQSSTLVNGFTYVNPVANYVIAGRNLADTVGLLLYSNDSGVTWNAASGVPAAPNYRAVAGNGSVWVAVGNGGTVAAYSSDGINWNETTIPGGNYNSVVWNGSLFCAVSQSNYVNNAATSPDGITWTQRSINNGFGGGPSGLAWNGSIFCSVSTSYDMAKSSDGITWNSQPVGLAVGHAGCAWSGVAFATGDTGNINPIFQYSADAVNWNVYVTTGSNGPTRAIAWGGTTFCAVGDGFYTAPAAGNVWTARAIPAGGPYRGITWDGSKFLAVGTSIIATSASGIGFTTAALPAGIWNGIGFFPP